MAQPTPFDRQSSFTLLAQQNPAEPYTGADLDAEFNAVKVTLDEVLANLEMIQRDDGDLANQTVGPDQLAASIDIGINSPSAWAAATAYGQYDTAFNGTSLYKATLAHTSGTVFADDLSAGKWGLLADFNVVSIADGSITTAKLASAAVTSAKLGTGAVTQTKLAPDAVVTDKILDANVTTAKLATNAVSTVKVQDAAITVDKLASDAVTTVKVLDKAVTLAKMADLAASTIVGRTSAGTGVPLALTSAQATAILDAFTGDSGSGGVKGLVPAPATGAAAARKFLGAAGSFSQPGFGAPDIIVENRQVSGVGGGTFTSGADRTHPLTTEVRDALSVLTVASNQLQLAAGAAGDWYVEWEAPAASANLHQSWLYDVTNAAVLSRGTSVTENNTSQCIPSTGAAVITVAGAVNLEIRHRCSTTCTFGVAASFGQEVYARVKMWKVA